MRIYLCILLASLSLGLQAQFNSTSREFVQHLINNKMYDEAVLVLQEKLSHATGTSKDSLNLQVGKVYYSLQQLPQSIQYLDAVSNANENLVAEATFFSAFNEAYLKRTDVALGKLTQLHIKQEQWQQVRTFEMAGTYLLRDNIARFDSLHLLFNTNWPAIQQQQVNFAVYRDKLNVLKRKSPLIAGTLSAVLPGAGKFYAGRKGNGIYTLLISALLGAQAYEAYRKDGVESARFIIYGSLFTAFYIGNIWGSTLAVQVVRNEKKDAIHHQILFDMHIPLRTIFQ